mmetsp:Transcript_14646/g.35864  ORF Transcript_14646/g.35864 Transcript_14646/m.35864 type:complete len:388 (-) Transcript_14646:147-1310(-)
MKLCRDAHVQLHVQRVVMSDKRPSLRASALRAQHRSLDLEKPPVREESANALRDGGPAPEGLSHAWVHDHIQIPAPVADVDVGEALELVRQREHRLREHAVLLNQDRQFALIRALDTARHANDVAHVHEGLEVLEGGLFSVGDRHVVVDQRLLHVELDGANCVGYFVEGQLAENALRHDSSCDGCPGALRDLSVGETGVLRLELTGCRANVPVVLVRVLPLGSDLVGLAQANGPLLSGRDLGSLSRPILLASALLLGRLLLCRGLLLGGVELRLERLQGRDLLVQLLLGVRRRVRLHGLLHGPHPAALLRDPPLQGGPVLRVCWARGGERAHAAGPPRRPRRQARAGAPHRAIAKQERRTQGRWGARTGRRPAGSPACKAAAGRCAV